MLVFILAALLFIRLRNLLAVGRISRLALFLIGILVFLILPSLVVPPLFTLVVLILGWDMVLSSYSFCVETIDTPEAHGWKEGLFFILVNPTLVYKQRGKRVSEPRGNGPGLFRLMGGLLVMPQLMLKMR